MRVARGGSRGGPGVQDPDGDGFYGTYYVIFEDPKTSKREKNVACVRANATCFNTYSKLDPPLSEILYAPLVATCGTFAK